MKLSRPEAYIEILLNDLLYTYRIYISTEYKPGGCSSGERTKFDNKINSIQEEIFEIIKNNNGAKND